MGLEWMPKEVSAQKVDNGKENYISAGTPTCDLFKWVQCSNQWAIPAPWDFICKKFMPWPLQFSAAWLSLVSLNKLQKVPNNAAHLFLRVPQTTISLIFLLSIGCPLIHGYSTNLLPCATIASAGPLPSTWLNSWKVSKPIHQLCSSSILPFFVFPLCACTDLARDCLMLHHLCGAVSLC